MIEEIEKKYSLAKLFFGISLYTIFREKDITNGIHSP